ncbi:MAG TPA: YwqG family protein [Anaerolineae bacterium]
MDTSSVASAFTAAGLGQMAHIVDKLVMPSIRIKVTPADDSKLPVGVSKLGGLPDLPAMYEWPTLKEAPMSFIAQLRLDELKGIEGASALPNSGMLWFFYDAAQQTFGSDPGDRAGRQIYFQDHISDGQLHRTAAPAALAANGRFKPCALTFSNELTLPDRPQTEVPSLTLSKDDQKRYESLYAAFPSKEAHTTAQHRLLGHPDTIQDDMRGQCQLMSNGITTVTDPGATDLLKNANDWQLLLQVDSDDAAAMQWASSGMLYFWIKRSDLAARNFDGVWVVLQSE